MVSEQITVLSDSIMLQKNIIFEYEEMAPKGLFYYESDMNFLYKK